MHNETKTTRKYQVNLRDLAGIDAALETTEKDTNEIIKTSWCKEECTYVVAIKQVIGTYLTEYSNVDLKNVKIKCLGPTISCYLEHSRPNYEIGYA